MSHWDQLTRVKKPIIAAVNGYAVSVPTPTPRHLLALSAPQGTVCVQ